MNSKYVLLNTSLTLNMFSTKYESDPKYVLNMLNMSPNMSLPSTSSINLLMFNASFTQIMCSGQHHERSISQVVGVCCHTQDVEHGFAAY
jgi:hypothetical protein